MNTIPVTVVVPIKNEERNLERCLSRLSRFSDIIVVDSSSHDRSLDIAHAYGATILNFVWDGRYPKKRNWFLLNHPPSTEWVLFLDADEVVTDAFCDEVMTALGLNRYDGYWINYTNYFLGKKLKFGVPQKKLALFRVGKALYEMIDEDHWSRLDMEVHEHPVLSGPIGEIRSCVEHNDYKDLKSFLQRHIEYASWEARRLKNLKSKQDDNKNYLTIRQKIKYRFISYSWYSYAYFIYSYILKLGVLDGYVGLQYARMKSWYFSVIFIMLKEEKNYD